MQLARDVSAMSISDDLPEIGWKKFTSILQDIAREQPEPTEDQEEWQKIFDGMDVSDSDNFCLYILFLKICIGSGG